MFNDKTTGKGNCSDIYQQNIGQILAEILHPLHPQPRAGMILPVIHKDTVLLLETYKGFYLFFSLSFPRYSIFLNFVAVLQILSIWSHLPEYSNPVFQLGLHLSRRELLQCPTGLSTAFLCLPFSKSTNP